MTVALKQNAESLSKWQDDKFGMFIHWGLYALQGRGEWAMFNHQDRT